MINKEAAGIKALTEILQLGLIPITAGGGGAGGAYLPEFRKLQEQGGNEDQKGEFIQRI